jgi:hypothetical protein
MDNGVAIVMRRLAHAKEFPADAVSAVGEPKTGS